MARGRFLSIGAGLRRQPLRTVALERHPSRSDCLLEEGAVLKDFKAFIMRGNVVDLAVGVIIGAAFGAIVKSLVDDILMPVFGLVTGGLDFSSHFLLLKAGTKAPPPYTTPGEAKAAGAVTV